MRIRNSQVFESADESGMLDNLKLRISSASIVATHFAPNARHHISTCPASSMRNTATPIKIRIKIPSFNTINLIKKIGVVSSS